MRSISQNKYFFLVMLLVSLIPTTSFAFTCSTSIEGKTDQELQSILNACDQEIAEQQAILADNQKQQVSLNQGISELSASINKSALEIKAQNLFL